MQKKNLS